MKLLFLDTETTGLSAADRICQVAFQVLGDSEVRSCLFKPEIEVAPAASAVSHITNEMLATCQPFRSSLMYRDLNTLLQDHVLVAHNAEFDIRMLEHDGLEVRDHICTTRVAQHIGGPPKFNLQYLRYLLNLDVDGTAHTADGDVRVLVALYDYLTAHMTPEEMYDLCN